MKMKRGISDSAKQKALEVFFDDPNITQALARVNVFVVDYDPKGRRISASYVMKEDEVDQQPDHDPYLWLESIHPDDREHTRKKWEQVIFGEQDVFEAEYRFLIDGEYRWLSNKGTMVYRTDEGAPTLYIAADRDITEERRLRQLLEEERARLAQLVIKDDFLNIPNRRYLETRQERFFIHDGVTPVAVLVVDIDNFKRLNTQLTHKGGDEVLQAVVNAIQTCLRSVDIFARYGGDEFVLVLPQFQFEQANDVAKSILAAVKNIALTFAKGVDISVSIGLCQGIPGEEENFWHYFKQADQQLLKAKALGKAQIQSVRFT